MTPELEKFDDELVMLLSIEEAEVARRMKLLAHVRRMRAENAGLRRELAAYAGVLPAGPHPTDEFANPLDAATPASAPEEKAGRANSEAPGAVASSGLDYTTTKSGGE